MKLYFRHKIIMLLLALLPVFSFGQDNGDDLVDTPADPVDTPLDGGILLLLAAGAGYGAKKYRQQGKSCSGGTEL